MNDTILLSIQVKNIQSVQIKRVFVGITAMISITSPLFCKLGIFRAVKTYTVIVVRFSLSVFRLLNNKLGAVIDC